MLVGYVMSCLLGYIRLVHIFNVRLPVGMDAKGPCIDSAVSHSRALLGGNLYGISLCCQPPFGSGW